MYKLMSALMVLAASSPAFATSTYRTVAECSLSPRVMDFGVSVKVQQYWGPIGPAGAAHSLSASVSTFTMIGHTTTDNYYSLTEKHSGAVGGSTIFEGKDFQLDIVTDAAPTEDGRFPAHLTYETNGQRMTYEMGCTFLPTTN